MRSPARVPLAATYLLALSLASGCGDEVAETAEADATSAQDPAVARMRRAFQLATPLAAGPVELGTTSPTGMTTTWSNCVERSAKRNDPTVSTVTYAFAGDGADVVNVGSGFGKTFIPDATQGETSVRRPDVLGYPAGIQTSAWVTLDVPRITTSGDLVVERVLKPATGEASAPPPQAAANDYERAVYPDARALAVAYVICPATGQLRSGGGAPDVVVHDDCEDPAFTRRVWGGADAPDACTAFEGRIPLPLDEREEAMTFTLDPGDASLALELGSESRRVVLDQVAPQVAFRQGPDRSPSVRSRAARASR